MTNKVKVKKENFFSLNNNTTRGHMYKLHKKQRAISQSFAIRSINDWNSLPSKFRRNQPTILKTSWINIGKVKDLNHLVCRN